MKIFRWVLWIGIGLGFLGLGFVGLIFYLMNMQFKDLDFANLPKFVEADFIDIAQIQTISKYRSAIGHSTDDALEKCRSLRHIFGPINNGEEFSKAEDKWSKIKDYPKPEDQLIIYSPVAGMVSDVFKKPAQDREGIGGSVTIRVDKAPGFFITIASVFVDDNIKSFMRVEPGQRLGVICRSCPGEINLGYHYIGGDRAVSYFSVMTDEVFANYQNRGMKSRDEAIISRDYRDSHPLTCEDPKNDTSGIMDNSEMQDMEFSYVLLNGYRPKTESKFQ